jgi:ABC-2 type transport system permease protein
MSLFMRLSPPAGFLWLLAHEVRMSIRARRRGTRSIWIGLILLLAYTAIGVSIGLGLRGIAIVPVPSMLTGALAATIVILSFMTTQAVLGSQRTLYESGDLDLLLSAPIQPRTVLLAKLAGIAASVTISFALLVLPMTLPIALLGHPGLLGIPALIAALALVSACLGLGVMLAVAAIAGPRAARTVGQIVAASLGGAIFLTSQILSNNPGRRGSGQALFRWFTDHHVGSSGPSALPGRAAFGDPVAIAVLLGLGIAVFAATGSLFGRAFLASFQDAGMHVARRPAASRSRRSIGRHFRNSLFATMFAKEWRLLARDPALAFQIVLRLIYLAPLMLVAFGGRGNGLPIAPWLAFLSVIIAGQVVGSFAWLTISAEDSPDLIAAAPVTKRQVERVKLISALVMAAPLAIGPSILIALTRPLAALTTLAFTAAAGTLAGLIELKWQKPMPRKAFGRRRSGSIVASLLTLIVGFVFGGAAALSAWLLT